MKRYTTALACFAIGLVAFIAIPAIAQYNNANYMAPGGAAWVVGSGGTLTVASGGTLTLASGSTVTNSGTMTFAAAPLTSSGVGTKNGATVTAVEYGDGVLHKVVLTLTATPISIADDAGVAQYGGVLIYTMPEGVITTLGAVIDGSITLGATGTIINTWGGGIALGTVTATTGSTLTSTEANIMPEVNVAAATAKVAVVDAHSVASALTESGARWLDGHTTAIPVYLNLVVDDDASHTAGTGTITGTVTITYLNLGDY